MLPWQFYLWWKWLVTFPWHVTPPHEVGLCVLISNQYITCLKKHLNHALKLKWTRWARGGLVDSQTLSLRWGLAPALSSASVVAAFPLSAEKWTADHPVLCISYSNSGGSHKQLAPPIALWVLTFSWMARLMCFPSSTILVMSAVLPLLAAIISGVSPS